MPGNSWRARGKWPQTVDESPECLKSAGPSPGRPSPTSPGSTRLALMSFGTKRTSREFGEAAPCHTDAKLKMSAEVTENLKTFQVGLPSQYCCLQFFSCGESLIFLFVLYFIRETHATIPPSYLNPLEVSMEFLLHLTLLL